VREFLEESREFVERRTRLILARLACCPARRVFARAYRQRRSRAGFLAGRRQLELVYALAGHLEHLVCAGKVTALSVPPLRYTLRSGLELTRGNSDTAATAPGASQIHTGFVMLVTCVAAMGGLLFGYDTAVISGAIGFVQSHFVLNAAETGWAASCALVGCIAGSALAGTISNRFGRRLLLVVAALLFLASAIGTAVAPGFSWFIVFRMIGGAGIGAASMASPLYIAEMAPPDGADGW